jgi:sugar phosphate isomerase/epimerase
LINLGCHSDNFGIFSPADTFSFISRLGFRYIDVSAMHLVPQESIIHDVDKQATLLRELGEMHKLTLDELFLDAVEINGVRIDPAAGGDMNNGEVYRRFESICGFAQAAGFRSIMGAPGVDIPGLSYEQSFENAAAVHAEMIRIAEDHGIAYHVEPSRNSLLNTPEKALRMISTIPRLRYTLDFLHFQINSIPQQESMSLIPYAGHMHARQAAAGIGKCPFEQGEIDYESIIQRLHELDWSGTIAMEFWNGPDQDAEGINPVEQNIRMKYELKCLIKKYSGYMPG